MCSSDLKRTPGGTSGKGARAPRGADLRGPARQVRPEDRGGNSGERRAENRVPGRGLARRRTAWRVETGAGARGRQGGAKPSAGPGWPAPLGSESPAELEGAERASEESVPCGDSARLIPHPTRSPGLSARSRPAGSPGPPPPSPAARRRAPPAPPFVCPSLHHSASPAPEVTSRPDAPAASRPSPCLLRGKLEAASPYSRPRACAKPLRGGSNGTELSPLKGTGIPAT